MQQPSRLFLCCLFFIVAVFPVARSHVWGIYSVSGNSELHFSLILIRTILDKFKTQFQNKTHLTSTIAIFFTSRLLDWVKSQVNCAPPRFNPTSRD